MCVTWNPGVSQVDEKVHECNTAVLTANYVGGNIWKTQQDTIFCWLFFTLKIRYDNHSAVGRSWKQAQPWSGHIFHVRSCVRGDYPSEVLHIVVLKVVTGKSWYRGNNGLQPYTGEISFHYQLTRLTTLTTFKILDITWTFVSCESSSLERRTTSTREQPVRGFAWSWMGLRARNACRWLLTILNHQGTCQGPRSWPTFAPWCSGGLGTCPAVERTTNHPRPEKKNVDVKN